MTPDPAGAGQRPSEPSFGLDSLGQVVLSPAHQSMIDRAAAVSGGPLPWQLRKLAEVGDVARMVQVSKRMVLLGLELSWDLRMELLMRVPVPCLPDPARPLHVVPVARLGVIYRPAILETPQPGYSVIHIIEPKGVWHPHVSFDEVQALCLGPVVTSAWPVRECLLLAYMALCMIAIELDPLNPAGVLNAACCEYYQRNSNLLPLSREPFLQPTEVIA